MTTSNQLAKEIYGKPFNKLTKKEKSYVRNRWDNTSTKRGKTDTQIREYFSKKRRGTL